MTSSSIGDEGDDMARVEEEGGKGIGEILPLISPTDVGGCFLVPDVVVDDVVGICGVGKDFSPPPREKSRWSAG